MKGKQIRAQLSTLVEMNLVMCIEHWIIHFDLIIIVLCYMLEKKAYRVSSKTLKAKEKRFNSCSSSQYHSEAFDTDQKLLHHLITSLRWSLAPV